MKKLIFILFIACFYLNSFSQDILVGIDGKETRVKIDKITPTTIEYHFFDSLTVPLRVIPKDEVFMIIYEDGSREVISPRKISKSEENNFVEKEESSKIQSPQIQVIQQNNVSQTNSPPESLPQKTNYRYMEGLGWIVGADLEVVVPYDESASEIYGYYPGFGFRSAYFGRGFGIEVEGIYLRNNQGKPYTSGNVSSSSSDIKLNIWTISGYWAPRNFNTENTFFLGGGFGAGKINEHLELTSGNQSASDDVELSVSEAHISVGMKIGHFMWEAKSSGIATKDSDINFGGLFLSAGFFF
jgi:hypothetical protein